MRLPSAPIASLIWTLMILVIVTAINSDSATARFPSLAPSRQQGPQIPVQYVSTSNERSPPDALGRNNSLYITALTNDPSPPYLAQIQCWALNSPLTAYPTIGQSLMLGNMSNLTYVLLPSKSGEGWHRPPHPMLFVLVSGRARSYVPRSPPQANNEYDCEESPAEPGPNDPTWDMIDISPGGPNQILIAADVDIRAKGHLTFYPGDTDTVAPAGPFANGLLPGHEVVHKRAGRGEGRAMRTSEEP